MLKGAKMKFNIEIEMDIKNPIEYKDLWLDEIIDEVIYYSGTDVSKEVNIKTILEQIKEEIEDEYSDYFNWTIKLSASNEVMQELSTRYDKIQERLTEEDKILSAYEN